MIARVEITPRSGMADARGAEVVAAARQLGVDGVADVAVHDLFFLSGPSLTAEHVQTLIERLLLDPVVATASWAEWAPSTTAASDVVEVAPLPGTTDSEATSLLGAAGTLGIPLSKAATGTRYHIPGASTEALERLAAGVLANEVVERFVLGHRVPPPFIVDEEVDLTVERIPMRELDDAGLLALSKERRLSLDLAEMTAIQARYRAEERDPTDAELEMFAQTWSEHCVHKTFKALITLDEDGAVTVVDSMFKTYIAAATEAADSPWLKSVFVDNAGIVGFEEGWDLAFKAETHNHPSALEPFGGANTGVGGVVRDVLGVSARPIATTDVLCFGPADLPADALPSGVLHPRRIAAGVVAGVGDYGNKMGIPTVNGAVRYDPGYVANPLVFVGCVGVLPADSHRTSPQAGDLVVSMGGRTGRDGLRGATFSSMEMDVETSEIAGASVQIGDPITEKQVMEALMMARDEGLYTAVTDCGAGGLSSAVGEMAEHLGAHVQLERVPLKYTGLRPWEIWLSEAQERMVLAVPRENWEFFEQLCHHHGVEAVAIGIFTGDGRLRLTYDEVEVADLSMADLHEGIPQRKLQATWVTPTLTEPDRSSWRASMAADLISLLSSPNIGSKEAIVRTFDHEVQGGTIVKPFVGPHQDGPSDGAVLRPLDVALATGNHGGKGVALSVGINPNLGRIDPYWMAWSVVDEAVRNCVCVGGDPDQLALLDNFCWGNPNLPDRLGKLVRAARGCRDAAMGFGAPYVSGKDSLNNEYTGADGKKHAIPGTLLISAMAIVPDVDRTATMDAKTEGDVLLAVGWTRDELGGSALYELHGELGAYVPKLAPESRATARAVHGLVRDGLVSAVHDASEGGVLVAVAEMALAGRLGINLALADVPFEGGGKDDVSVAFSESNGRYLITVPADGVDAVVERLGELPHGVVGAVNRDKVLRVRGLDGQVLVGLGLDALVGAFTG